MLILLILNFYLILIFKIYFPIPSIFSWIINSNSNHMLFSFISLACLIAHDFVVLLLTNIRQDPSEDRPGI